jgi:hypothetical protein
MAAGQDFLNAERVAQQAVAQARTVGLVRLELEASLALGQIQNASQQAGRGPRSAPGTGQKCPR